VDKKLSASGGFASLTPYQRLCTWTPLGDWPPDLLLGARHGPSWQILDVPLTCMLQYNASGINYAFTVLLLLLLHRKCTKFWRDKNEADQSDPRKLWKSVDVLLGRGRVPASSAVDIEVFNQFFTDKVANVRQNTSGAPSPTFSHVRSGVSFDDVINAVRRLPDKSSAADPLPTTVVIQVIDLLLPFITELLSHLLATGRFPAGFRQAFITLIVKKPGLDAVDASPTDRYRTYRRCLSSRSAWLPVS